MSATALKHPSYSILVFTLNYMTHDRFCPSSFQEDVPALPNGLNGDEQFCMGMLARKGAAFPGYFWLRPQGEAGPSV